MISIFTTLDLAPALPLEIAQFRMILGISRAYSGIMGQYWALCWGQSPILRFAHINLG